MATVSDLDRLKALLELLEPLSKAKPGQPVTAEAWNTLVSVLLELTRNILTHEQDSSVPPHTHEEQVALSWLNSRLRTLVENGPLSDPAAVRRVLLLERKVDEVGNRATEAHRNIGEVRTRLSEVATRDLVREATLSRVGLKVETLKDGRDDVLALRKTLDTIRTDVKTAVEVAEKFKTGGEIADFDKIDKRLQNLEILRERLTTPKGDLLDALELEKRLTELNNTYVTKEDLSDVLEGKLPETVIPDLSRIKEELFDSVVSAVKEDQEKMGTRLKEELLAAIPDVDAAVERGVREKAAALMEEQIARLHNTIPELIEKGLSGKWEELVTKKITEVLAETKTTITREVKAQVVEQLQMDYQKPVFDDNFLVIKGIGESYNEKLNKAGIFTYSDLAAKSPETIARILGLTSTQVAKLQIVEQAKELAARNR
jgi:predicted flap endonuclease-1-like 5' DNA nuclease